MITNYTSIRCGVICNLKPFYITRLAKYYKKKSKLIYWITIDCKKLLNNVFLGKIEFFARIDKITYSKFKILKLLFIKKLLILSFFFSNLIFKFFTINHNSQLLFSLLIAAIIVKIKTSLLFIDSGAPNFPTLFCHTIRCQGQQTVRL